MARPREFSERQGVMHGRCINWGLAMAGHVTNLDLRCSSGETREPDGLDAELIEAGIIQMRTGKHLHYWLFRYLYLGGRSNVEASINFKKTEEWVRARHREGLDFLIRHVKTEHKSLKSAS